jgi:sarcosine oxidase gamma subunit
MHATVAPMFSMAASTVPSATHISHAHVGVRLHGRAAVRVLAGKNYAATAH